MCYVGQQAISTSAKAIARIAFVRGSPHAADGEIHVVNADRSGQRRLTHNTVNQGMPVGPRNLTERGHDARWSPDGEKISFVSSRDGNLEIYVLHADRSGRLNLSQNPLRIDHGHAWSLAA